MNIFRNTKCESLESNKVLHDKEVVNKVTKFNNETSEFIQDISKLLAETVKQHHIVDNEHHVLGELFDKVK